MTTVMAPDELVEYLIECLAFDGDIGTDIDRLWGFAQQKVGPITPIYKQFIWKWLLDRPNDFLILLDRKQVMTEEDGISDLDTLIAEYGKDRLLLFTSEENQWLKLTGHSKKESLIGLLPFTLLCAVSRSRQQGLTNIELAKLTGQDSRSIFGRVNTLIDHNLVKKCPVIQNSNHTHLIIHSKFVEKNTNFSEQINDRFEATQLRRSVVEALKNAKNQIRNYWDLKEQLGYDKPDKPTRAFSKCIKGLVKGGYIKKVYVTKGDANNEKTSKLFCLMFIKDYEAIEESDEEESDVENDDATNDFEEQVKVAPSKELRDQIDDSTLDSIRIEEQDDDTGDKVVSMERPLFNQFYPLENQVYDLVNSQGMKGISVMTLQSALVGKGFARAFSRLLDVYVDKPGKNGKITKSSQPTHIHQYNIIRGIDFSARIKYYRYFSQLGYCQFTNSQPDPAWGCFKPSEKPAQPIHIVEKKINKFLPGGIEIAEDLNGRRFPVFRADTTRSKTLGHSQDLDESTYTIISIPRPHDVISNAKLIKKGRPRKSELEGRSVEPPQLLLEAGRQSEPIKRGRGRPKKVNNIPKPIVDKTKSVSSVTGPNDSVTDIISQAVEGVKNNLGFKPVNTESSSPSLTTVLSKGSVGTIENNNNIISKFSDITVSSEDRDVQDVEMVDTHVLEAITNGTKPKKSDRDSDVEMIDTVNSADSTERLRSISGGVNRLQVLSTAINSVAKPVLGHILKPILGHAENFSSGLSTLSIKDSTTAPFSKPMESEASAESSTKATTQETTADVSSELAAEPKRKPTPSGNSPMLVQSKLSFLPSKTMVVNPKKHTSRQLSFAQIERQDNILKIVEENGGAVPGGLHLYDIFREKYDAARTTTTDKKTLNKVVDGLVREGRLIKVVISVPTTKGPDVNGRILILPTLSSDSPAFNEAKRLIALRQDKCHPGISSKPIERTTIVMDQDDIHFFNTEREQAFTRAEKRRAEQQSQSQSKLTEAERREILRKIDTLSGEGLENGISSKIARRRSRRKAVNAETGDKNLSSQVSLKNITDDGNENLDPSHRPDLRESPFDEGKKRKRRSAKVDTLNSELPEGEVDPVTAAFGHKDWQSSSRRMKGVNGSSTARKYKAQRQVFPRDQGQVDPDFFYRAVLIIRSFSANPAIINWKRLVETLNDPDITVDIVRMKWPRIRDMFGGASPVAKTMKIWENLFIYHFERDTLPFDASDADHIDISQCVAFWKRHRPIIGETTVTVPWLLNSKEENDKKLVFMKDENADETPLESFYNSTSMVKTDEIFLSTPFIFGATPDSDIDTRDAKTARAARAIKSIIATDPEEYDIVKATEILKEIGEEACASAIRSMEKSKSIIYLPREHERVLPGRNFLFSERFLGILNLRIGDNVLKDAAGFERALIDFSKSSKGLLMSPTSPDSTLVSILDLICNKKVDLLRVEEKSGRIMEGYKSRFIEKDKLDCDIVIRVAKSLLNENKKSNTSITTLSDPIASVPFPLGESPSEYIWTSVSGKLNHRIYKNCVSVTLMAIALRPGITSRILFGRVFKGDVLTLGEIEILVSWLEKRKCIRLGDCNGLFILSGWYNALT
ncbi:hypothetical protein NADFUDRAFT_49520 [Nadsonia fulvescens var. elongata DSM 6958]|uniref:Uncharacterized protein n=1 Tax=Nadsonia fulvescens var. elongata DSM 6958 TaxID=857566 RepID=A0A1E3PNR4_9ASCO|nr:hypothetical protein NADFUDRAFT_49520 [Nadsonia fulvescens var. elongata DSM 6958]